MKFEIKSEMIFAVNETKKKRKAISSARWNDVYFAKREKKMRSIYGEDKTR